MRKLLLLLVCLLLVPVVNATPGDALTSLASYYSWDTGDYSGATLYDIKDRTGDGTITEGSQNATGKVNQCWNYYTGRNTYTDMGDIAEYDLGTGDWSFVAMIRPNLTTAGMGIIAAKTDSAFSDANGWWWQFGDTSSLYLKFCRNDCAGGASHRVASASNLALTPGNWACVAVTNQYGVAVRLYHNGTEVTYSDSYTDWASLNNAQNFNLGAVNGSCFLYTTSSLYNP